MPFFAFKLSLTFETAAYLLQPFQHNFVYRQLIGIVCDRSRDADRESMQPALPRHTRQNSFCIV